MSKSKLNYMFSAFDDDQQAQSDEDEKNNNDAEMMESPDVNKS